MYILIKNQQLVFGVVLLLSGVIFVLVLSLFVHGKRIRDCLAQWKVDGKKRKYKKLRKQTQHRIQQKSKQTGHNNINFHKCCCASVEQLEVFTFAIWFCCYCCDFQAMRSIFLCVFIVTSTAMKSRKERR